MCCGEFHYANEELLCKPVCLDLPARYPEQVAQAPVVWGFDLVVPARYPEQVAQAPVDWGFDLFVSLLVPAVHCVGSEPWRPFRWMLDECRHTPPLINAFGNTGVGYGSWHLRSRMFPVLSLSSRQACRVGRAEALSCPAFLGQVPLSTHIHWRIEVREGRKFG